MEGAFSSDKTVMIVDYFFTDRESNASALVIITVKSLKDAEDLFFEMVFKANSIIFNANACIAAQIDIICMRILFTDPIRRDGNFDFFLIVKLQSVTDQILK